MRSNYDFSGMRGERNPYVKKLKQPVTIRLDSASVRYFKELAAELDMPYQNLINLYLRDCVVNRRRPAFEWVSQSMDAPQR